MRIQIYKVSFMKKLVLFAGLVVATTSVFAANEAGTYTLGLGLGYYDFAKTWHLNNDKYMPYGEAGYNFTDNWGMRYQLGRVITDQTSPVYKGMNGIFNNVDAVYHFSRQFHGISPYVTFGLGLTRTNGYVTDANFFNFNGGVGAQYFFNDTFALDAQVQDLYTNSKTANDLLYTFGVEWQFGGAKNQVVAAPVVAKPVVVNTHNEVAPPDAHAKPLALFKLNSAKVNDAGKANIAELANKLKAQPNARVRLDGFADDTGTFEFNKYLSTKRAQSVAYYLQKDGISAMRIDTYGYGNAYPLSSNESEAGREMNRRVAAMIIND